MPGCPTIFMNGVTHAAWECLKGEARRIGVPTQEVDASGTISAQGATAKYEWDAASGRLSVTFTQLPQWIDCGTVEARIRAVVRGCGGA